MKKQQGFTIIELVVVILLLGILTATALPRFMDITDDARLSVAEAVAGGLSTSAALFRAQAIAQGLDDGDTANAPYDALDVGASQYPAIASPGTTGCGTLYTTLLQAGRPDIITASTTYVDPTCTFYIDDGSYNVTYNSSTGETSAQ